MLLILAAVDVIFAGALAGAPAETRATDNYKLYAALLPLWAWGALWAAVGVLCLALAWTSQDRLAYGAATGLKVFWALLHLLAWAVGVLPRGYVAAAIWLLAAGLVMVISTVPRTAPTEGGQR
ncbi:hypothetical protein [Microbispora triticiradicis]|uniref:hypothetical protein n=1 Tax=Microbispora triticiradicis TaxID=2200763 RepID=UPI001AD66DDF|nr:hypothetical protein [Microbispora triticiradicis]MBO4272374.1 hypothetical protein [Microbispora triticiradicis]